MRVRNKATGEINKIKIHDGYINVYTNDNEFICPVTIRELNEGWEEYAEPKEYWYIDGAGVIQIDQVLSSEINMRKSIGNYFETREDAEQVVRKLKAWKRLKDKGISFEAKVIDMKWYLEPKAEPQQRAFGEAHDLFKDIMFVFGGEE